MRISDWSSDVCSSDLHRTSIRQSLLNAQGNATGQLFADGDELALDIAGPAVQPADHAFHRQDAAHRPQIARLYADLVHRSEEHTPELQSLMRISYAVFCLKKKKITQYNTYNND